MLILILICVLVGLLCRWLFLLIFDSIFKPNNEPAYIDKSTHYHNHLHVGNIDEIPISSDKSSVGID